MSITIDPTLPADSESPRQGAARIRSLTLELLQLLSQGGGSAVSFSAAPFSVDTAGNVTIPTTLTVPTPASATQAAQYGQLQGLAVTTQARTTTLLHSGNIATGANLSIFSLTSTPPATPTSTQKYRALVYWSVYFISQASSGAPSIAASTFLTTLSDNASLFTFTNSTQCYSAYNSASVAATGMAISDATRTSAAGSVSFALTGYCGGPDGGSILANSQQLSSAKSYLTVAWIPAQ